MTTPDEHGPYPSGPDTSGPDTSGPDTSGPDSGSPYGGYQPQAPTEYQPPAPWSAQDHAAPDHAAQDQRPPDEWSAQDPWATPSAPGPNPPYQAGQPSGPPSEPAQGYPPSGYPAPDYGTSGYPAQGYPAQGYPAQGYPAQGYPAQGYPAQGYPAQGVPAQGYPAQEYPPQGGPAQAYPPQAYPPQGYPAQGHPAQGAPAQPYVTQQYPGQPYSDAPPLLYDPAAAAAYGTQPKKMSLGVKILLWVIPIAVIAGIGGAAVALTTGHDKPKATAGKTTPAAVNPTSTSTAAPPQAGLDTFAFPPTLLGLPKSSNPELLDLAKGMQDMMAHAAAGTTTAIVYQSTSDPTDLLLLAGVPDFVASPAEYANSTYTGMKTTLPTIKPKKAYPAGSMGGIMWCADASVATGGVNLKVGICDVTDTGGSLLVFYYSHSAAALASDMPALRAASEKR